MTGKKAIKGARLDVTLAERGIAESRSQAQRWIMAGNVLVDGQLVLQPGRMIAEDAVLLLKEHQRYVSRGGEKLESALTRFAIQPEGWICADVGSSTGGFTDCLLQHGAKRVYAIDVGKGILDWRLRKDPRVILMEGTNARFLDSLPEKVDLVTIDASFISLKIFFPVIMHWLNANGIVVALIKPQFEAGKGKVGKGGVVRDQAIHRSVLEEVLDSAKQNGFSVKKLIPSPIKGPAGNIEFLIYLDPHSGKHDEPHTGMIDHALEESSQEK